MMNWKGLTLLKQMVPQKDPVGMRLLATLRVKMVILTPTKNQIFLEKYADTLKSCVIYI